jgi:hypothetical protein
VSSRAASNANRKDFYLPPTSYRPREGKKEGTAYQVA